MSWIDGARHRIATLFRPNRHEQELRQELEFHQSLDAQQVGDADAARRRLGNRTYYLEETRRMTWLAQLDVLKQDIAYGWRSLRRNPGLTAMVIVTLTLGLGVNAASFTFLDQLYLRQPDGVVEPEGLRRFWYETSAERSYNGQAFVSPGTSYPGFRAIAAASGAPNRFALYETDNMLFLRRGDAKTRMRAVFATASYFDVLGVRPALGRFYTAQEDSMGSGAPVVVLGYRFWQRELGGDTSIIGRVLNIERTDYAVVGVMQRDFRGLDLQARDVWIPLASIPRSHWVASAERWWQQDRVNGLAMLARDVPAGFAEQATIAQRRANVALRGPSADTLSRVLVGPLIGTGPGREGQDMKIAKGLGAVSVIILLIAGANVINLLLARAERRRREVAVRLALGISRARLIRLITTETLLLSLLAGTAAVLAAAWGGTLLRALLFPSVEWYESPLHWRVVAFAAALAVITGLVAGLVPAFQASRPKLASALKEGARDGMRRTRLRSALVVAQAALSVVLIAGAALFVQSLRNVQGLDIGYDTSRLLFAWVSFEPEGKPPAADLEAAMTELEARIASRPGVEGVARSMFTPMQGLSIENFWFDGDSLLSLRPHVPTFMPVTPEFFRTVGMAMLRGRPFSDRAGVREVVINDQMARRMWPGREALGRCIRFKQRDADCHVVVGIVENGRQGKVIEPEPVPLYYLSPRDPVVARPANSLIVRTSPESEQAARAEVRSALAARFPQGEVSIESMNESLEGEFRPWRLGATLFTAFGLLALLVAMVGVYSTVAYGVTQRTHEFGVRAALGARVHDVLAQVVGEGVRVVALGVVVGLGLTLAAGKLVASMLFGVRPNDAPTMIAVSAILLAVAAIAAIVPAWRAARVDPVTALRAE